MDKCREEFEKQRYWIGLFRDAVDFDEKLGRYVLNGQRKLYAFHLDSFNEKWAIWQESWQHQQAKVEELKATIKGNHGRIAELERLNRVKAQAILDLHQEIANLKSLIQGHELRHQQNLSIKQKLTRRSEELQQENQRLAYGNTSYYNQAVKQNEIIDKLQKRVDKALELMQKPVIVGEPAKYVCARFKEIEQALKGEGTPKKIPDIYGRCDFKPEPLKTSEDEE
ncbi:hypothetical protein OHX02_00555 [Acinetobacter baumannii]|nr:hypothetical protein [Acinetobacter baumannii]